MPKYTLAVTRAVSYTEHGTFTTEADDPDDAVEVWNDSDGVTDVVWNGKPDNEDLVTYDDWDSYDDPVLVEERPEFPPVEQCLFCEHWTRRKDWEGTGTKCSECGNLWGSHTPHLAETNTHSYGNQCNGFKLNGVIWMDDIATPANKSPRAEFPPSKDDCLFCYGRDHGDWSGSAHKCSECGRTWSSHSYEHNPAHTFYDCYGFKLNGKIWRNGVTNRPEYPPSDQCLSCEHFARKTTWHRRPDIVCSECGHEAGGHSAHRFDGSNVHDHKTHGCNCCGLKVNGKIWLDEWTDEDDASLNVQSSDEEAQPKPEFPPKDQCLFCEHYERRKDWKNNEETPKCSECGTRWSSHTTHKEDHPGHHIMVARDKCKGFKLDGKIWMSPPENLYGFFGNDNVLLKGTVMCADHVIDVDSREIMQSSAEASGVWDGGDAQPIPNPNTLKCLVCAEDNAA